MVNVVVDILAALVLWIGLWLCAGIVIDDVAEYRERWRRPRL